MATTTLEQLKSLDSQRAKLLEGAKSEAMNAVQEALAELNALGFHYDIAEGRKGASLNYSPPPTSISTARAGARGRPG